VVMAFSGTLYGALGGGAYLVMAGIAGLGAAAGFALSRCWRGGLLTATES
jgi:hypothetical protein